MNRGARSMNRPSCQDTHMYRASRLLGLTASSLTSWNGRGAGGNQLKLRGGHCISQVDDSGQTLGVEGRQTEGGSPHVEA